MVSAGAILAMVAAQKTAQELGRDVRLAVLLDYYLPTAAWRAVLDPLRDGRRRRLLTAAELRAIDADLAAREGRAKGERLKRLRSARGLVLDFQRRAADREATGAPAVSPIGVVLPGREGTGNRPVPARRPARPASGAGA